MKHTSLVQAIKWQSHVGRLYGPIMFMQPMYQSCQKLLLMCRILAGALFHFKNIFMKKYLNLTAAVIITIALNSCAKHIEEKIKDKDLISGIIASGFPTIGSDSVYNYILLFNSQIANPLDSIPAQKISAYAAF